MNAPTRRQVAETFGIVLRTARDAAGLSQEQLAEAADTDRAYPSLLARGMRQPTLYVILRLAAAVRMEPGWLVSITAAALNPPPSSR